MSETDLAGTGTASNEAAPRRRSGLSGMVLASSCQLATELNVPDISGMRKRATLIAAIKGGVRGAAARRSRSRRPGPPARRGRSFPLGETSTSGAAPAADAEQAEAPAPGPAAVVQPAARRCARRRVRATRRRRPGRNPPVEAGESTAGTKPVSQARQSAHRYPARRGQKALRTGQPR
ncbi:hypothetical protein HBB16_11595 [Pseudonocardia sp. MCCB 268]|nr:hypothetical protein [Pseudonocardia cytotoxica]